MKISMRVWRARIQRSTSSKVVVLTREAQIFLLAQTKNHRAKNRIPSNIGRWSIKYFCLIKDLVNLPAQKSAWTKQLHQRPPTTSTEMQGSKPSNFSIAALVQPNHPNIIYLTVSYILKYNNNLISRNNFKNFWKPCKLTLYIQLSNRNSLKIWRSWESPGLGISAKERLEN